MTIELVRTSPSTDTPRPPLPTRAVLVRLAAFVVDASVSAWPRADGGVGSEGWPMTPSSMPPPPVSARPELPDCLLSMLLSSDAAPGVTTVWLRMVTLRSSTAAFLRRNTIASYSLLRSRSSMSSRTSPTYSRGPDIATVELSGISPQPNLDSNSPTPVNTDLASVIASRETSMRWLVMADVGLTYSTWL